MLLAAAALTAGAARAFEPVVEWSRLFDGGGTTDKARGVAVDRSGNVVVNGSEGLDFLTVKYSADGEKLWDMPFDGASTDEGRGVAVDAAGNIYACGYSVAGAPNYNFRLVKYGPSGNVLWTDGGYDSGCNDWGYGVAVDASGNYCMTGYSAVCAGNNNIRTVSRDSAKGLRKDVAYTNGSHCYGYGIAVDSSGYFYVTGASLNGVYHDYRTIKYDNTLNNEIWNVSYDTGSDEMANGVAVDASGNVFVTGFTGTTHSLMTIKYNSAGTTKWIGTVGWLGDVTGNGIAVDARGDVWVAASANNGTDSDSVILHYDNAGKLIWSRTMGAAGDDEFLAVATGAGGVVVVAGYVSNGTDYDFRIVKFRTEQSSSGPVVDVKKGSLVVAPNVLDLSKAGAKISFHVKGEPGKEAEIRVYDSAGHFMGSVKAPLSGDDSGKVDYTADGLEGMRPAPGGYWAVARGGGVNDKKKFFVVRERK